MSLVEWLAQPSGRLLTLALLHFVWQGLLISFILAAVVELGRIRRPAGRYACSLAALFAITVCPVVTWAWLSLTHETRAFSVPAASSDAASASVDLASWTDASSLLATWPGRWAQAAQPYALAAWLGGVLIFGSRLLAGVVGVARLRRARLPLTLELAARVERLGRRLSIDAAPLVYLSRQAAEAMAVGLVRPFVLVPAAWAAEMPLEMLEAVIAHELAHLRRRDLWVILLQRVAETVLFYHPAVWWLSRRLRIERELCADDLAVTVTGQRLIYAQTLEQVAKERRSDGRTALAAFVTGDRDMRLLQRIRNVLGQSPSDRSRPWPAGLVALALPLLLWGISPSLFSAAPPAASADERAQAGSRDAEGDVVDVFASKIALKQERDAENERTIRRREIETRDRALRQRAGDDRLEDLTKLVRRLAVQVEDLQAEVAELRAEKGERKPEAGKQPLKRKTAIAPEAEESVIRRRKQLIDVQERELSAAERDAAIRERKLRAAGEAVSENLERKIRAAIAEGRDVIVDKDAIRRAVEQALEAAAEAKELGLEAAEKAKAHVLEAAEKSREAAESALDASEKEAKAQAREAAQRARRAKEEVQLREKETP